MPYRTVRDRTRQRFSEVQVFLNYLHGLEPEDHEPASVELRIMKGLFIVHLYGAFEKSINDVVETSLSLISSKRVKNSHFYAPFLSIALCDQLKSLKDSKHSNLIYKASELFIEAASKNVIPINETAFSTHLQNTGMKTLERVMQSFGMPSTQFERKERVTVDEVVDKRNAVAHGRDSAAYVGERYRAHELREKMDVISTVIDKVIDTAEQYYSSKNFIKSGFKRHYA